MPDSHTMASQLRVPKPAVNVTKRPDGSILIETPIALGHVPRQFGEHLQRWAKRDPDRVLFAERGKDGRWVELTYGEAQRRADAISQALIDRGHGPERPIACLSDKSLDTAVLQLAAMQIGIPYLPISTSFSLASTDFARLKHVVSEHRPSLIYVPNTKLYGPALNALPLTGIDVIVSEAEDPSVKATLFSELLKTKATQAVQQKFSEVGHDTIAKLLLTSGSTGMPKAVMITHGVMCTNGAAVDALWPFLADEPHVVLDWLPWNHVFGSTTTFNQTLRHGGTLYMDEWKPQPDKFAITIRNMREVRPTIIYNVPKALDMLVAHLEADEEFARATFERLKMIFFAAAELPTHLWERIDALSVKYRGSPMPIFSAIGSTETGPMVTMVYWPSREPKGIGLPVPTTTVKLVPVDGKFEMRVKGPSVSPGYYNRPDLSAKALDEEGYFMLGDAVRFVDPDNPLAGLAYNGRISENFKLLSGVWVQDGELRYAAVTACVPLIQDVVITGHGRDEVGILAFLSLGGCRQFVGDPNATLKELSQSTKIREGVRAGLQTYNRGVSGGSRRIARALLLDDAPSVEANEITDKAYINQRRVLDRRAHEVERLYDDTCDATIVVASPAVAARA